MLNVLVYFFWQHGGITLGDPSSPHYLDNLVRLRGDPVRVTHPGQHCIPVSEPGVRVREVVRRQYDLPPTYLTVFTAMFMHGGLLHLGGNMLFLWIFGNNVEDAMGPVKFVVFYLLGGLAAPALQIARRPGLDGARTSAPRARSPACSAATSLLFPRARVVTVIFIIFFFTILELPALLFLGIWFVQQAAVRLLRPQQPAAAAAASRTSPTSAASRSGCWRSSCSRTSEDGGGRGRRRALSA